MTTLGLDTPTLPVVARTRVRFGPHVVRHPYLGGKEMVTGAACRMADLLERQSELLADLGMQRVARQACREVRQLRLLAALEG